MPVPHIAEPNAVPVPLDTEPEAKPVPLVTATHAMPVHRATRYARTAHRVPQAVFELLMFRLPQHPRARNQTPCNAFRVALFAVQPSRFSESLSTPLHPLRYANQTHFPFFSVPSVPATTVGIRVDIAPAPGPRHTTLQSLGMRCSRCTCRWSRSARAALLRGFAYPPSTGPRAPIYVSAEQGAQHVGSRGIWTWYMACQCVLAELHA